MEDFRQFSYIDNSIIAMQKDETLWTWGWNYSGEIGDGTGVNKNWPIQIGTDFLKKLL